MIAGILLAAGRSRRFGGDKLATLLDGRPLLDHAAETMRGVPIDLRLIVRAGDSPPVEGFTTVVAADAGEGMGRSLAAGVRAAEAAGATAVLVMLGDMPFVTTAHVQAMLDRHAEGAPALCSTDGVRRLPPAVFGRELFARLAASTGDQGARASLVEAEAITAPPGILRDIDVPADLAGTGHG